jgi:hypothetical protein
MSYLSVLRLHFAGKFQANVSTVNNDPGHFENATFKPSYQQMQQGSDMNGWFNPQGDAAFRLLGCRVTSAWMANGEPASPGDSITQSLVADGDSQVCAKLVDLDSEQQLVSTIWGLQVRITDPSGSTTLLQGDFLPAAFADIWDRATGGGGGGDIGAGAMFQSVLTNLRWGDLASSAFLQALRASVQAEGLLSIKFNVDGLDMNYRSPDFMCGRLVGSIGPASAAEPRHLVLGRQFMAQSSPQGNFFTPVGGINFFAGRVDETTSSLLLDLGNALSTSAPGGALNDLGDLVLGVYSPLATPPDPAGTVLQLTTIAAGGAGGYASDPTWYPRTAGVVVVPLTAAQLAAVGRAPLVLFSGTGSTTFISEWTSGAFLRADGFVFRLSPGETLQAPVYATKWGQPLAGAQISFVPDPSQLQPANYINPHDVPPVATPLSALEFNRSAVTDQQGRAILNITAGDPANPRGFIDGQVYGIRPGFADAQYSGPQNQWNFISLLVWDAFAPQEPVTWHGALAPIFQQYANLYPVMQRFLDLSSYEQVCANVRLLQLAFGLDPANPNSMPVTRDLSPAKRRVILKWLANPLLGSPRPSETPTPAAGIRTTTGPMATQPPMKGRGGKAEAAARRVIVTQKPPSS